MKKIAGSLVALGVALALLTAPAAAHNLVVDPPGGDVKTGWVGGGALPGAGQGLVPGGPTGEDLIAPAHAKGLIQACHSVREQGRAAADLWGPPGPGGCAHGTF